MDDRQSAYRPEPRQVKCVWSSTDVRLGVCRCRLYTGYSSSPLLSSSSAPTTSEVSWRVSQFSSFPDQQQHNNLTRCRTLIGMERYEVRHSDRYASPHWHELFGGGGLLRARRTMSNRSHYCPVSKSTNDLLCEYCNNLALAMWHNICMG